MSWAGRRQATYLGGLFLFIGVVLFIMFYSVIFAPATCGDRKQNGEELGVDCGGSCQKMCLSQISEPVVLWTRAFPVSGNIYNILAYVENQNKESAVPIAPYEFRVYDDKGLLIEKREGSTFIPPNQRFAVFEARIDSRGNAPKSVTFEFKGPFDWYKKKPTMLTQPIKIEKVSLNEDINSPIISGVVVNDSIYDLPEFDVIAIVYDENQKAIAVSKTRKPGVSSSGRVNVSFTWPQAFSGVPAVKDLLLSVNPFTTPF